MSSAKCSALHLHFCCLKCMKWRSLLIDVEEYFFEFEYDLYTTSNIRLCTTSNIMLCNTSKIILCTTSNVMDNIIG